MAINRDHILSDLRIGTGGAWREGVPLRRRFHVREFRLLLNQTHWEDRPRPISTQKEPAEERTYARTQLIQCVVAFLYPIISERSHWAPTFRRLVQCLEPWALGASAAGSTPEQRCATVWQGHQEQKSCPKLGWSR